MKDPIWERVQAAFDARRDPLRDAALARELAEAPAERAELVALRELLDALERPRRRRRAARLVAAAALLLAVVGALALRGERAGSAEDALAQDPPSPAVEVETRADAPRPAGRVLSLTMTTTTRGPRETRVARSDGRTLRRELRAAPDAPAEPRSGAILATHLIATVTR